MTQSLIRLPAGLLPCLAVLLLVGHAHLRGASADSSDEEGGSNHDKGHDDDAASSGPFLLPTDCTDPAGHSQYIGVMYGLGRYARGVDELGTFSAASGPKLETNPKFVTAIDNYMSVFAENISINITLAGTLFTNTSAIRASAIARAPLFHVRRHAFTAHQMWVCPDDAVLTVFSGTIANGAVNATGYKFAPALQLQKYTQVWVKQNVGPSSVWKVRYSLPVDEFPAGTSNKIAWVWPA